MTQKYCLLSILLLTATLDLLADITNSVPLSDKAYANTVRIVAAADTSTNVALLPANLICFLGKDLGDGTPANQFLADEMMCEVTTVRRTNLVVPQSIDGMTTMAMSNSIYYLGLPSMAQAFSLVLVDNKGREMPKTEKGIAYSQPPVLPKSALDLHRHFKLGTAHWPLHSVSQLFRPSDIFSITNKGTYELTIKFRICVPITNSVPDTDAMTDSHMDSKYEKFGVVESTPLHIMVIKK